MKKIATLIAIIITTAAAQAGNILVYSYDASKLLGTEYANDFRQAKEQGQPLYPSVAKAKRIVKQCKPSLVSKQNIATSEDNNFLIVSRNGNVTAQLLGANMMLAPLPPGAQQINVNPESSVVSFLPSSSAYPKGLFILAYSTCRPQN